MKYVIITNKKRSIKMKNIVSFGTNYNVWVEI